jgi:nicotinate-nucleotide pyrophosphorylase (carboxylating)
VEARNIEEVKEALSCGVDRIMLDNMNDTDTSEAVQIIDGNVKQKHQAI